jgi:ankyrin repeat protein
MEQDNQALDVHEFIDQHLYEPELLRDLLIDMAFWQTPDLAAAERILELSYSSDKKKQYFYKQASANARIEGNIIQGNPGSAVFTTAASYGKTDYLKLLLKYGAKIEQQCPMNGFTALLCAAQSRHTDTLELLIAKRANVNATGGHGTTALMLAAKYARVNNVKLLLENGANKALVDEDGRTALDLAKRKLFGKEEDYNQIIKLLN